MQDAILMGSQPGTNQPENRISWGGEKRVQRGKGEKTNFSMMEVVLCISEVHLQDAYASTKCSMFMKMKMSM